MRGMTAPVCPVCATPHAPDAEACEFCGVSLREPEAKVESGTDAPPHATEDAPTTAPEAKTAFDAMAAANDDDAMADAERIADDNADGNGDASTHDAEPTAPAIAMPADDAETASDESAEIPAFSADSPPSAAAPAPPPRRGRAPSFARKATASDASRRRLQRIEWSVIGALTVVLLVQVVASDFDQLAAGHATRPWLQRMCNVLRCTLPPWREAQALRLLQRDVRANPQRPGTLRVSASFRNDARWAQPWPRLRVTLSDADGRMIAARDFAANQYLGATPTANGIASGQVAGAAFDVVDPSPRVTAFTFELRQDGMARTPGPR